MLKRLYIRALARFMLWVCFGLLLAVRRRLTPNVFNVGRFGLVAYPNAYRLDDAARALRSFRTGAAIDDSVFERVYVARYLDEPLE